MRVFIAGGGGVRFYLARRLAEESHEVTIVNGDPARARFAEGKIQHIGMKVLPGTP